MNKYNRRSRPGLRYQCEFWSPSVEVTTSGELKHEYDLVYRGPFSKELPQKPIEIVDSGRSEPEQRFHLIGQWCQAAEQVTAGMFCVIPQLQKVYAVVGNPTDKWGDRKKIYITVVDNVARPITLQLIPSLL